MLIHNYIIEVHMTILLCIVKEWMIKHVYIYNVYVYYKLTHTAINSSLARRSALQ